MMGTTTQRWAAAGYWLHRAIGGLIVGTILARPVVRSVQHFPDPDAALTQPGGVLLLDAITQAAPSFAAVSTGLLSFVAVWWVIGMLPLSLLLLAFFQGDGRGVREVAPPRIDTIARAALGQVWLSVVDALSLIAIASVAGIVLVVFEQLVEPLGSERTHDLLLAALCTPIVLLLVLSRPWLGLCRALDAAGSGWLGSLGRGIYLFRTHPWAILWSWAWPQLLGFTLFLLCAWLSRLLVGASASVAAIALQQVGFLALTLGRIMWLARATRWVEHQPSSATI